MDIKTTKKRFNNMLILSIDSISTYTISQLFTNNLQFGKAYLYGYYEEDYLYIATLYTHPQYRGLKYASTLLQRAKYEAKKNKCKMIKLMDHSDLFNNENNIYLKHGFTYIEQGQPDMCYALL
jgi:GNAT superfamily N-acetyltransferase